MASAILSMLAISHKSFKQYLMAIGKSLPSGRLSLGNHYCVGHDVRCEEEELAAIARDFEYLISRWKKAGFEVVTGGVWVMRCVVGSVRCALFQPIFWLRALSVDLRCRPATSPLLLGLRELRKICGPADASLAAVLCKYFRAPRDCL